MKNKVFILKIVTPLLMLISACNKPSTNLIYNGSSEIPGYDTIPKGWQNIKGNWTAAEGDSVHPNSAIAQDSSHYFFAGYGLLCILQQDVKVDQYATTIDNKKQQFILSGFEQTLDQGLLSDQGMLKVECLDATKKILDSSRTDTLMSKTKWKAVTETFLSPASTRFIRVQLVAFRNVGGDNDGYFDNIRLVALPYQNYLLIIFLITIVIVATGSFVYFRKKRVIK
ncbi:MAG: hypothetical protein ABI091_06350 [Ferruginibacter sp.]